MNLHTSIFIKMPFCLAQMKLSQKKKKKIKSAHKCVQAQNIIRMIPELLIIPPRYLNWGNKNTPKRSGKCIFLPSFSLFLPLRLL